MEYMFMEYDFFVQPEHPEDVPTLVWSLGVQEVLAEFSAKINEFVFIG